MIQGDQVLYTDQDGMVTLAEVAAVNVFDDGQFYLDLIVPMGGQVYKKIFDIKEGLPQEPNTYFIKTENQNANDPK